ncbi:hypothetical protein [Kitasatospora griseola]|uniref:hypothetical protein n=1 Tax=Kitasatospora griseola TaxID=2064 RepID=UPI0038031C07
MNSEEFAELALGVDEDLFVGVPGESVLEYRARMDVALAVLADLRREDPDLAEYAERLLSIAPVPLRRPAVVRRMASVERMAA